VAKFSEQFIQQVAQATDIVELIGQYIALKKRGKEFVGLCPFHDDHKPSLNVSPSKQIFKCFSCGAGGGVFQYLMMYDKLTFPEAVRTLAERANIPLPTPSRTPQASEGLSKNDLVSTATFAARFFRDQLNSPTGKGALQYARDRGLSDESISRFGLGFAPDAWDALLEAARKKGISEGVLLAAGLAARRDDGSCYDRFHNRLIFPIIEPAGKVIAFGGRALDPNERAKYLNSPETPLFDKSSQLYALNWAREAISSSGQAIVVEGYLDALMPLQAGVDNVVATLGTALTDRHVRLLARYAREAVLVFDADAAGAAATERALEVFLTQRLHVRVATVSAGKDPCDYVLSNGPEALRKLVDEAPDAIQYIWNKRLEAYRASGGNLADRRKVVEDFLRLVVSSSAYGVIDEVRRGQLAQHIAHLLNVSPTDLQQQMRRIARRFRRSDRPREPDEGPGGAPPDLAERHIIEVLLNCPDLFDEASRNITPEDFSNQELRVIAEGLWGMGQAGRLSLEELLACEKMSQQGGLLTDLAAAGESRGNFEATLAGALEHIEYRRKREDLRQLKSGPLSDENLRSLDEKLRGPDARRHPRIM